MKEGWEYKKLGEVANFISGYTPNKEEISNQGEYPYFKVAEMNIAGNELYMKNTSLFVNSPKKIYPKGSIIFPKNGGAIYTEKKRILDVDSVIDLNTEAIFPTAQIELMYLYFLLTFTKISSFDKGGGLPSLDLKKMSEYIIPVPSLSEQQSIVDYLDSAFAKIDAMKANAEKALGEAKALFQASLKEMMEPKEGWEEKTLGDMCEIKSILVDPTEVQYKNLLHVGGANIVSETGELIDLKTAAEEELTSGKFTFNDNDVLYNKIRPYLIKVSRPDFSGLCSADMYPLTSKKGMTRDYLYYILVSRDFTDYAIMNSARAGMPKLNRQALFAYKCMLPPLSEQQSIVETLDSLKSKVDRLQENYDKISQECDALKQAILRQVFE